MVAMLSIVELGAVATPMWLRAAGYHLVSLVMFVIW